MTSAEREECIKNMRNGTYRGEHYGDYWDPEEDEKLKTLFYQNKDYNDMALELGRSDIAVFNRCLKLKLHRNNRKPYEKRTCDSCLCTSCSEFPDCPKLKEQPKK